MNNDAHAATATRNRTNTPVTRYPAFSDARPSTVGRAPKTVMRAASAARASRRSSATCESRASRVSRAWAILALILAVRLSPCGWGVAGVGFARRKDRCGSLSSNRPRAFAGCFASGRLPRFAMRCSRPRVSSSGGVGTFSGEIGARARSPANSAGAAGACVVRRYSGAAWPGLSNSACATGSAPIGVSSGADAGLSSSSRRTPDRDGAALWGVSRRARRVENDVGSDSDSDCAVTRGMNRARGSGASSRIGSEGGADTGGAVDAGAEGSARCARKLISA